MPYLVSSIIAVVSAMVIMFTRYEADDSTITAELDRMKSMFVSVDGFVNTYVESGGDLTIVNFEELYDAGILLGNIRQSAVGATDKELDSDGSGFASTLTFPGSTVIWQLIPNKDDSSSYKILVDMTNNTSLMSKAVFSESFSGSEFCEKMLFGTKELNRISYDSTTKDFTGSSTNKNDGLFVCIVYK
jgi:hypothetical protein